MEANVKGSVRRSDFPNHVGTMRANASRKKQIKQSRGKIMKWNSPERSVR